MDLRGEIPYGAVALNHRGRKILKGFTADEVYGRASKAAAGEARAQYARDSHGGVDQEIDFRTAHLIVVAEAGVGLEDEPAHFFSGCRSE